MSYHDAVNIAPDADELLATLAQANRFTMAELAENRTGRIADHQMAKLGLAALRPVFHAGKALLGWLTFVVVIRVFVPDFVIWITGMIIGQNLFAVMAAITAGCVIALIVGLVKSMHRITRLFSDLSKGRAEMVEGRVWASRGEEAGIGLARIWGEKEGRFHYVLNNDYFEVADLRAFQALEDREKYRLYYAPKSKLLLSIEPAAIADQSAAANA